MYLSDFIFKQNYYRFNASCDREAHYRQLETAG